MPDNQGITVTDIYTIKHICAYMHFFLPQVLYTLVNDLKEKKKQRTKKKAQMGTSVRARVFTAGLLARSQLASGRSCDRSIRIRFSVVFLGPRANAELVSKFHTAQHASHSALPMLTLKISP
jgi:hypothetical protein